MLFIYIGIGVLALIIGISAQVKVSGAYSKYSKMTNTMGISGREVAEKILRDNGINNISVNCIKGELSDNYNHGKKTLNLSASNYNGTTISAVAVAAHEAGHALQYKDNYLPIKIRNFIIPTTSIVSRIVWPLIIIGILVSVFATTGFGYYIIIGSVILMGLSVLLNLVTLPVEYNASRRAMEQISKMQLLGDNELPMAKEMLNAAALTYVAAFIMSILYMLRDLLWLLTIFGNRD